MSDHPIIGPSTDPNGGPNGDPNGGPNIDPNGGPNIDPIIDPIIDPTVRRTYAGVGLADDVTGAPLPLLRQWWAQALSDERIVEPDAMVVATVDEAGHPDARTVLLKQLSPAGFTFFTNTASAKGRQLRHLPYAALVLPWHPMHRQVRVRGRVRAGARELAGRIPTRSSVTLRPSTH